MLPGLWLPCAPLPRRGIGLACPALLPLAVLVSLHVWWHGANQQAMAFLLVWNLSDMGLDVCPWCCQRCPDVCVDMLLDVCAR